MPTSSGSRLNGFVIDGALFPHNSAFMFVRLRRCEPVVFNSTCSATFLVSSVIVIMKLRVKREFFEEGLVIWVVTVSPRKQLWGILVIGLVNLHACGGDV